MLNKFTSEMIIQASLLLDVDPAALDAVIQVESSGVALQDDGRPPVLFEAHVFRRELLKEGFSADLLDTMTAEHPNLISKTWNRNLYKGGKREWDRLEQAKTIHVEAALRSASYGAFQIMGFNGVSMGYNIYDFVEKMHNIQGQMDIFVKFIVWSGLHGALKSKNWTKFARGYNGPNYELNRYDTKLAAAYGKAQVKYADFA